LSINSSGSVAGSYVDSKSVLHGFLAELFQPTVALTPAVTTITTTQSLSMTVSVSGGSGNPVPTGSVTLQSGTYSSGAMALSNGSATISIAAGQLAVGNATLSASYSGDSNYVSGTGTATVTVTSPNFTIASAGTITVTRGSSASGTITVTPSGGFTGKVGLTASISSSPVGAQNLPVLSFGSTNPVNITGTTAGTATLTVSTTAASSGLLYPARPGVPWSFGGGAVLACALFFATPLRRRGWKALLSLVAVFVVLGGGMEACGGGGSGSGNHGTTPGSYGVTITGTAGALNVQGTATIIVQ
jgi:hypothetical protein